MVSQRWIAGVALVMALPIGLQADTWHTDNLSNTKRSLAVEDTIMEWRPIVQLNVGSPPADDSLHTDYYLELRYAPTQHTLLMDLETCVVAPLRPLNDLPAVGRLRVADGAINRRATSCPSWSDGMK